VMFSNLKKKKYRGMYELKLVERKRLYPSVELNWSDRLSR